MLLEIAQVFKTSSIYSNIHHAAIDFPTLILQGTRQGFTSRSICFAVFLTKPITFIFLMGCVFMGNVQVSMRSLNRIFGGNGCTCDLRRTFEQFINMRLTIFGCGNKFRFIYFFGSWFLCFFVSVCLDEYSHALKLVDFGLWHA